ncbi:MAG: hypothetical protein ACXVC1_05705 [Tumebacillaceae bacterium]
MEKTDTPGAVTSGLISYSVREGPREEKSASLSPGVVVKDACAPNVMEVPAFAFGLIATPCA